ncbi:MAG: sortase [Nocardioides sp.]|nr:sortase [Nocardioides sp.]
MTRSVPVHAGPRRGAGRWWAGASVLALLTVAVLVVGARHASVPPPTATAAPSVAAAAPAAERPPDVGEGVVEAAPAAALPVHLWIPRIGVASDLVALGLNPDETVEVPSVPAQAGWYDHGPAPGQLGSSVILGHLDSREGPAVFFRLDELVAGDRLRVRLADGTVERFEVVRVATYANEDFPARRVYAGSPRRSTLNLVTCGGEYDPDRGGYQSNVVAFTKKVRSRG